MPTTSFVNAGFLATLYSPDGATIIAADLPMLVQGGRDVSIIRDESGVPLVEGIATGVIPLTDVPSAAQCSVVSIRRGGATPYDVVDADTDESAWATTLILRRRVMPIGSR